VSVGSVLFIDANQYLDLYRTVGGEKLLAPLQEQQGHILVTAQIVDEVHRRKVSVTAGFWPSRLTNLSRTTEPLLAFPLGPWTP
jgi:hypothetical protein